MITSLTRTPLHTTGSRILLAYIGAAILWRVTSALPEVPFLYGALADVPLPPRSVYTLYTIWSLAALGLITARYTRVCTLIALLAYSVDALAGLHNAGDHLARITLVYALLLDEDVMRGKKKVGPTVFFHNLGVIAITVQLCIVYVNASLWKLYGPDNLWLEGTMLYYVTHLQSYGMTWSGWLFESPFIVYTATYMTLLYQLSFLPLLFTRWHWVSVLIGAGLHLGIGLVLGLMPFGLTVTGLVLFTLRDATWRRVGEYLRVRTLGGRVSSS